ncbi:MAG: class I SAM-dependent methyltransferase [Myxococcales bacterium]|nr:class I SAM-dependent methyltransferase [Myxococcales bacterium]
MTPPEDRIAAQADMLGNRLRKTARHLRKWARREGVDCYRLYDRDIPEVPVAVDWYAGRLAIAEYARDDMPDGWAEAMAAAAGAALEVPTEYVYLRRRARQRGSSQYVREARTDERFVVREGELKFFVNLADYLDTGLFLDHRRTRALVGAAAAGRRVLNLYAYTASFTVYAAAGGARRTVSVDLSQTYLDWAADNLALNGFGGPAHALVRADVGPWLDDAAARGERFDLIVLDPPTFSNSKRMQGVLDLRRDHGDLIDAAMALLAPGGGLWFSTNARRLQLDPEAWPGRRVTERTAQTVPDDFRRRPHRTWYLEFE